MSKELIDKIITYNYNEFGNEFGDCIVDMKQEIERLNKCYCERTDCSGRIKKSAKFESVEEENKRLNNIINELRSDLKTLWIVLWNMDTEMTGYQNEVFDKYYDEFHKN